MITIENYHLNNTVDFKNNKHSCTVSESLKDRVMTLFQPGGRL